VSKADAVCATLWVVVTLYAVLGGADFGAGVWDLTAGDAERGAAPRALIERVLTPVWEANHVWLIFMLVITWTAFPSAFAAIMSTLFIPLWLAALGIVLRGAGFAFRHTVKGVPGRRALGATFALSSVLTPFFMGTVAGAIATGRVPADGSGDRLTSWLNITSIGIGALLVAGCAYLAAVFLVSEARRAGDATLERYFRLRALAAGAVAGAIALVDLVLLRAHARPLFDDLLGGTLALVLLSAACGLGALVALARGTAGGRPFAVGALAAVIFGWGLAQRPDILPGELTIDQAAAPASTLTALLLVTAVALAIVVPSLTLLMTLHQRALLEAHDSAPRKDTQA
jgi:cytochrome bd ubiquinol oxidase subunit II